MTVAPIRRRYFRAAASGAAYRDLRSFPLRLTCGMIEVAVPDDQPGMDEPPVTI